MSELKPGWLQRQFNIAKKEITKWPPWMRNSEDDSVDEGKFVFSEWDANQPQGDD